MKIYKDKFHNTAIIEKVSILPYYGAERKQNGFRLVLKSDYDNEFIYHVSVHETFADAYKQMNCFSCGEWHKGN